MTPCLHSEQAESHRLVNTLHAARHHLPARMLARTVVELIAAGGDDAARVELQRGAWRSTARGGEQGGEGGREEGGFGRQHSRSRYTAPGRHPRRCSWACQPLPCALQPPAAAPPTAQLYPCSGGGGVILPVISADSREQASPAGTGVHPLMTPGHPSPPRHHCPPTHLRRCPPPQAGAPQPCAGRPRCRARPQSRQWTPQAWGWQTGGRGGGGGVGGAGGVGQVAGKQTAASRPAGRGVPHAACWGAASRRM